MTELLNKDSVSIGANLTSPPLSLFKVERNNADFSQAKLASQLNVSKSAIIRTEQGLFTTPNDKYVQWLVDNRGYSVRKLTDVYSSFQVRTRKYFGVGGVAPYIHNSKYRFEIFDLADATTHPLVELCYAGPKSGKIRSVASFIKAFCLPYSEVQRWGTYPHLVKTVPSSVLSAFKDAGYSEGNLNALTSYYSRYRKNRGYEQ